MQHLIITTIHTENYVIFAATEDYSMSNLQRE